MNNKEMDMTSGNLLKKIIIFAIPVLLSSVLQLLFNACDLVVVGRFAGDSSLAAVGSTGAITALIINIFMGVSIGANVAVARAIGRKDFNKTQLAVHTAILFSLIAGAFLTIFGVLTARTWLEMMNTTAESLDKASLYLQIYFGGMIFNMLYNFGAAVLRAVGETKKPLYYLMFAGVCNVVLNLIFVIVFNMDVAGVAVATIISQCISAILVIRCLTKKEGYVNLNLKKLLIDKNSIIEMVLIGLPAGVQGSLFSISNVLIQTAINSFENNNLVAGNTAAGNLEGFIYVGMNAFYQACITFTGQNYGAGKIKNCRKVLGYCMICGVAVGLIMGGACAIFAKPLIGLYTDGVEAVGYGILRISLIGVTYFLCGFMDVIVGGLRGLGNSFVPMCVSVLGVCGLRVGWIYTVFAIKRDYELLLISYPVSWFLTGCIQLLCYIIVYKKIKKKFNNKVVEA